MSNVARQPLLPLLLLLALFLTTAALAATAAQPAPTTPTAMPGRYVLTHELPGDFGYSPNFAVDPANGRIYRGYDPLIIVDTRPTPVYQTIPLGYEVSDMALSHDGGRLFMAQRPAGADPKYRIAILDTATRTVTGHLDYLCDSPAPGCQLLSIAAGPDDRLYLAFTHPPSIDVYDSRTGQRLSHLAHSDGSPAQMVVQGNHLYTVGQWQSDGTKLHRFDISAVAPVLKTSVVPSFQSGNGIIEIAAAPDDSYLLVWTFRGDRVLRLDSLSLAVTGDFIIPDGNIKQVLISPSSDETILVPSSSSDLAYAFDARSGALRRVLPETEHIHDGDYVALPEHYLANVSDSRLRVMRPDDYVSIAPVVLARYCGGLLIDDFSDPTSGWPIANNDTTAYYYANEREQYYAILHHVPDAWSGVTRGDTWQKWPSLSVLTTTSPGVGSTGLIFGLNSDWSHFYSFEIIPELERWVLYFYLDGWRVWATDESEAMSHTGHFTRLELKPMPDGQLALRIEGYTVYTLPNVPSGRVGLGGGSFLQGVGHRYDDYTIEPGPFCRPSTRSARAAIEQSPLLPPPPLPVEGGSSP